MNSSLPTPESPLPPDDLRALLEDVAAGRVDPDSAARLVGPPVATSAAAPRPARTYDAAVVRRLEIMADTLDLRVVADPTVDVIDIDGALEVEPDGELLRLRPPTRSPDGNVYRFGPIGGLMAGWLEGIDSHRVTVRARPDLALSMTSSAGRVELVGMQGGFTVRMAAGALRATDVRGPFDVDVTTGSAKISALVDRGASVIRGQMSSVELTLLPGSDVIVTADSEMGSAKVDGTGQKQRTTTSNAGEKKRNTTMKESVTTTVGAGTATLGVTMQMGTFKVKTP